MRLFLHNLEWKWLLFRSRLHQRILEYKKFGCRHWKLRLRNKGKKCVSCWLKKEMYDELNKEVERVILYGGGS